MRCKKHFLVDCSSNVGVCASCLRERLLALTEAPSWTHQLPEPRRSSDPKPKQQIPHPSPIVFPRSASPYISRRKSDTSDDYHLRRQQEEIRFFSTPQVGPAAGAVKKKSKFHAISDLFRSKSAKSAQFLSDPFSDPAGSVSSSNHGQKPLSAFIYPSAGDRKNATLRLLSLNDAPAFGDRRGKCRNRGMSPAVDDDSDAESLSPSGYSPERRKSTPSSGHGSTRAGRPRAWASPARSYVVKSGIGICLSPLMRPSSSRQWIGKSVGPGGGIEAVYSGEVRSTVKPHLSTAASFCSNRSRKLADFGKFDRNR